MSGTLNPTKFMIEPFFSPFVYSLSLDSVIPSVTMYLWNQVQDIKMYACVCASTHSTLTTVFLLYRNRKEFFIFFGQRGL